MVLKSFDPKTGKFNPEQVKLTQTNTDSDTGNSITSINYFSDLEKSINSRICKSGDKMTGTLEFENELGVFGSSSVDTILYSSKILYLNGYKDNNVLYGGNFRVVNVAKDISQIEDNEEVNSFNLLCDDEPTEGSNNLLTSGAIYAALQELSARITNLE